MKKGNVKLYLVFAVGVLVIASLMFVSAQKPMMSLNSHMVSFSAPGPVTVHSSSSYNYNNLVLGGGKLQPENSSESMCNDTDGGINYFVYGVVTVQNMSGKFEYADKCYNYNGERLYEMYCDKNNNARENSTLCSYGCAMGACLNYYRGDMNCDGKVDKNDIDGFVLALEGDSYYNTKYPSCDMMNADTNKDGNVDFDDIDSFRNMTK